MDSKHMLAGGSVKSSVPILKGKRTQIEEKRI
jgi:hypothetical protein